MSFALFGFLYLAFAVDGVGQTGFSAVSVSAAA